MYSAHDYSIVTGVLCTAHGVHYTRCNVVTHMHKEIKKSPKKQETSAGEHLPLIATISSVCFTFFSAILLQSLISCIIKQPVYISQSGFDVHVCVLLVGLVLTVAFWNQSRGILWHMETTSSFLVTEDTRQMIILWKLS